MAPSAAPAPSLAPELFAQIRAIQLRAQRLVTDMLAGGYESAFRGRGMEFERVRDYQPGDDVRTIDWNVTARMRTPFVKEFREERELTVMLLVDVSSSGAFGSAVRLKNEVAAELAAVLAYTAIRSNDRVGLIIFSDRIEHALAPKKGRAHVWRVIRDILSFAPPRRRTDVGLALDHLGRLVRRRAVTFVISDLLDEGAADALKLAGRRHDLTAIVVIDPREQALPEAGIVALEDPESGAIEVVDTDDAALREAFAAAAAHRRQRRRELLRGAGIGEVEVLTDRPFVDPLLRFFRHRERRRGARL